MSADEDSSPFRSREPLTSAEAIAILEASEIEVLGQMPYSSNATFLTDLIVDGEARAQGIYKPLRGERPLWDFPDALFRREIAAYELSEFLGWGHVPPTIEVDGPAGVGSLQLFVPAHFEEHYFTLLDRAEFHGAFREICAFDLIANNTDRKSGHVLLGEHGELWAIDNSLCFHTEFKVRTVIWDFADEPLPAHIESGVTRVAEGELPSALGRLLSSDERDALIHRAQTLSSRGHFPDDPTGRRWPWPMI